MERSIVKTIKLEGVVVADEPVEELVIREPTAGLMLQLSELETKNQHAKKQSQVRDPFPVIFEALTGRDASILHFLPMSVGQEITAAIGEAMGVSEDGEGKG